jgi:hypothetical protein
VSRNTRPPHRVERSDLRGLNLAHDFTPSRNIYTIYLHLLKTSILLGYPPSRQRLECGALAPLSRTAAVSQTSRSHVRIPRHCPLSRFHVPKGQPIIARRFRAYCSIPRSAGLPQQWSNSRFRLDFKMPARSPFDLLSSSWVWAIHP